MVRTIVGLRWWATLALAGVLTVAGVAIDLLVSGELGVVFTVCFAGGCLLATAWARRDELFVPMVQPPLLLVVAVPVVVAATGSLPSSGGTVSTLLAIGGPLINAFPTLAVTTAVCLALGFVRTRLEPYLRPDPDEPRRRSPAGPPPRETPPGRRPRRPGPARPRPRPAGPPDRVRATRGTGTRGTGRRASASRGTRATARPASASPATAIPRPATRAVVRAGPPGSGVLRGSPTTGPRAIRAASIRGSTTRPWTTPTGTTGGTTRGSARRDGDRRVPRRGAGIPALTSATTSVQGCGACRAGSTARRTSGARRSPEAAPVSAPSPGPCRA